MDTESELTEIKKRNERVELDKAWETSWTRRGLIGISTYLVIVVFLHLANTSSLFITALVPAIGYLLSTLSLPFIKKWWMQNRKN